jgi:hypothetical protein
MCDGESVPNIGLGRDAGWLVVRSSAYQADLLDGAVQAADDPVLTSLAGSMLAVVEAMTEEVGLLTKRVLDEVRIDPACRHLMTLGATRR